MINIGVLRVYLWAFVAGFRVFESSWFSYTSGFFSDTFTFRITQLTVESDETYCVNLNIVEFLYLEGKAIPPPKEVMLYVLRIKALLTITISHPLCVFKFHAARKHYWGITTQTLWRRYALYTFLLIINTWTKPLHYIEFVCPPVIFVMTS